jgi:putative cell wall-binding protein
MIENADGEWVEGDAYLTVLEPTAGYARYAGANRYETAYQMSTLWAGSSTVLLTTGKNWPDGLGGSALAGVYGAPIFLTDPLTLSTGARNGITAMGASKVIILGADTAVSPAVETALHAAIPGITVERIGGVDRYDTSYQIATAVKAAPASTYAGTVFLATGLNYPDALAASPVAWKLNAPVLLIGRLGLTTPLRTQLAEATRIVILGSPDAVSSAVETQIRNDYPGATVQRVGGGNRYETAAMIGQWGVDNAGLNWWGVGLAKGTDFPDALAAGPFQGAAGGSLLLTPPTDLSPFAAAKIHTNRLGISGINIFGGTGTISDYVKGRAALLVE